MRQLIWRFASGWKRWRAIWACAAWVSMQFTCRVGVPTLEVGGEAFLRRVYSQAELAQAEGEPERLASRFAGKEAVLKVLGSGISRVGLGAVEILCEESGRPWVKLGGAAMAVAEREGLENFEVSLCHEQDYALAVACATQLEARQ